jgi:hypothetical protein
VVCRGCIEGMWVKGMERSGKASMFSTNSSSPDFQRDGQCPLDKVMDKVMDTPLRVSGMSGYIVM